MVSEKKEHNFLEASLEGIEAAWDTFLDNEALKAVPVIGSAFKLLKGVDQLRDRALKAKMHKFLTEPALRSALEARKLRNIIMDDEIRSQEIGEMLFLVLDKVTDMTKPILLAKAYAAYLDEELEAFTFEAVAHAIDTAFLRDLETFLRGLSEPNDTLWKNRLVAVGLLEELEEDWDGNVLNYQETPLGASLRHAINRVRAP